ncbi:MAG: class I tRNA ligase family protein, partial [Planctomycetota bacterium]
QGVEGVHRFLQKLWKLVVEKNTGQLDEVVKEVEADEATIRLLNQTIRKVGDDIESFGFNTAISAMMIFVNHLVKQPVVSKSAVEKLVLILAPFAPHIAEELWEKLGHAESLAYESWPKYDKELVKEKEIELAVQVNGKVKDRIVVAANADVKWIEEEAQKLEKHGRQTGQEDYRRQAKNSQHHHLTSFSYVDECRN